VVKAHDTPIRATSAIGDHVDSSSRAAEQARRARSSHEIQYRAVLTPESVTPLPGLGVQLATVRGLGVGPSSTARRFVPLDDISTVVIHEGLRRWSVRYYLGIVRKRGDVVVAFDVSCIACVRS
jgi:hypothetical protein